MFRRILRGFGKLCIAAFCLWHMTAIGIYSLFNVEQYPILKWLDSKREHVRPYILVTSQWQRWNLFSPDPLRRVIEMDFEVYKEGRWQVVRTLNEHGVSYWQRAPELKIMRRMEQDSMQELRKRYIADICRTEQFPPGTPMRITKIWHVIPRHEKTESVSWWYDWKPEWREPIRLLNMDCPSRSITGQVLWDKGNKITSLTPYPLPLTPIS